MQKRISLIIGLVCVIARLADGQGSIPIILTQGSEDPTTEGVTLYMSSGTVGPVVDDLGKNAWMTAFQGGGTMEYLETLSPQQQSEVAGANWTMSLTLRVVQLSSGNIFACFFTGSQYFQLLFGSEKNGDPFVQTGLSTSSPEFVLNGAGSTYNNYQLVYSATSGTANLFVNGTDEINGIAGDLSSQSPEFAFGIAQDSFPSQANWNLVSLSVVPVPSAASLLLLGGGGLLYFARLRRA